MPEGKMVRLSGICAVATCFVVRIINTITFVT